ncbi:MAG: hypothetical protein K8R53_13525, partial [Bacteroidales bacterium]|nr:hypothetical protein [Bacteroidales bacterium]
MIKLEPFNLSTGYVNVFGEPYGKKVFKMIIKNKNNIYKISISIIFGLLGFFFNFHTIIFPFGGYSAAILFGLLFPMLITLSWGWRYGLLSALAGGCQSMWWLWGPSNGYAILLVVPPFTLWVVWHGIFAELRRKQKTHKWWLSMYIVEIPFRILSTINLLTLSRWAITLNPPSWRWALDAPNTISLHFSIFVTIKQAAVAFVVLLLADVLLNVSHVRIFFKLKEYIDSRKTGYIISIFLLLGCFFWLLDSVFYAFAFHRETSFVDLLALDIPNYNIFTRTVFFIFCLVCGLITSKILRRQKEGEIALKETNQSLEEMVYIASHDLQSPLISMEGFASNILYNYRDKLDEQGVHQLERIKANTQRMHVLVLSLLDISRLNTEIKPFITFSAGKVVEKVLSDLSLIITKAGTKVETGKMPKIFGDQNRIEGVFRNLVINSVIYGGKKIEIGFKDETFFVKDDGIGIDKDQLENIFKPGERLKDIK